MLNLGVRAHDFGKQSLSALADTIAGEGFSCIQLALHKAIEGFEPEPGFLSPGLGNTVRDVFAAKDIRIAVLGCYINPIHPDAREREKGIRRFEEHLAFARDFGCAIVGTETGSRNADNSYHPGTFTDKAFGELVQVFSRLAKTAERFGTIMGVEGVADVHTVFSYDRMTQLLDAVGSPNLRVIYDPANFMSAKDTVSMSGKIAEAFDRFGDRMVAIHAKDCRVEHGKKTGDLPAGTGSIPYPELMRLIKTRKPGIHVLLEDVNPGNVAETARFVRGAYEKQG